MPRGNSLQKTLSPDDACGAAGDPLLQDGPTYIDWAAGVKEEKDAG
jgi:hypothetical protein